MSDPGFTPASGDRPQWTPPAPLPQQQPPATPDGGYASGPAPSPAGAPGIGTPPVAWPRFDPGLITGLPIEERSHPFFYRTPRWRWWRPVVAAICVLVVAFVASLPIGIAGFVLDGVDLTKLTSMDDLKVGPWTFLANNVLLASTIVLAMLGQWASFGQRPGWLSSVVGHIRWGWLGRCVLIILPIWLVMIGLEYLIGGLPPEIHVRPYTVLMIAGILITTPFQAAGEEYLIRGLEQRLVASYFKPGLLGWGIATLVSSLTFMALHGAGDVWLNIFYFAFGAAASWVTWKTGGLEAAIAIHAVNNLLSEALMPFTDFSGMFDRKAGAGDPSGLIQVGVMVAAVVLLAWLGRRAGVAISSAPGRGDVDQALAQAAARWETTAWQPTAVPTSPAPPNGWQPPQRG